MKCKHCEGRGWVDQWFSTDVGVAAMARVPCQHCLGMEPSCCEGAAGTATETPPADVYSANVLQKNEDIC